MRTKKATLAAAYVTVFVLLIRSLTGEPVELPRAPDHHAAGVT